MKFKPIWLLVLFPFLVLGLLNEYQVRKVYQLEGEINSCRYEEAGRYCSLFVSEDNKLFLLTEGSVDSLKKIDEDIGRFYQKPVKISAHILGQKIRVENLGEINRIEVIDYKFQN